jgi:hypothetical protein
VARQRQRTLVPLSDDLKLLESGLDSLSFAIIVAKLEDDGSDSMRSIATKQSNSRSRLVISYTGTNRVRTFVGDGRENNATSTRPPEFFAWCRSPLLVPVRTRVAG